MKNPKGIKRKHSIDFIYKIHCFHIFQLIKFFGFTVVVQVLSCAFLLTTELFFSSTFLLFLELIIYYFLKQEKKIKSKKLKIYSLVSCYAAQEYVFDGIIFLTFFFFVVYKSVLSFTETFMQGHRVYTYFYIYITLTI